MSIVIASVVLATFWIGSEGAHVGYMSIAIASVLLVAVVLFFGRIESRNFKTVLWAR